MVNMNYVCSLHCYFILLLLKGRQRSFKGPFIEGVICQIYKGSLSVKFFTAFLPKLPTYDSPNRGRLVHLTFLGTVM